MKSILISESEKKRILEMHQNATSRQYLMEGFSTNTPLDFQTVAGYKSALFPQVQYEKNGAGWSIMFSGSKTLGNLMGMSNASFQSVMYEPDPSSLLQRSAYMINLQPPFTTRAEVETGVKSSIASDGAIKNPFGIKAGGQYKDKAGKTITWGRPGFTAGSEIVDAICKLLGIA